jgi:hypothetical protein
MQCNKKHKKTAPKIVAHTAATGEIQSELKCKNNRKKVLTLVAG